VIWGWIRRRLRRKRSAFDDLPETLLAAMGAILQRFNELHPDRDELAQRTGWPRAAIDTIDVYRGSPVMYVFPNRQEFTAALPGGIGDVRFTDCGSYDLANCCPILSFRKA